MREAIAMNGRDVAMEVATWAPPCKIRVRQSSQCGLALRSKQTRVSTIFDEVESQESDETLWKSRFAVSAAVSDRS